jgi:hypothetical protein
MMQEGPEDMPEHDLRPVAFPKIDASRLAALDRSPGSV